MAKISSEQYGELNEFGVQSRGGGGPFIKVFITGEPRENQTPGKMQAMVNFDEGQYLINEKDEVYFIPLFIKKIREKYVQGNNDWANLVYFSWSPDNDTDYPEGAKVAYIFAGVALDENLKPIPDPNEEDRSAFIYFKNSGVKMGGAIDFVDKIHKVSQDLDQLSDDPKFEESVVTPRRFIVKASVTTQKTDYGNKYVFQYDLHKQLPDEKVVGSKDEDGIMQKSKKWVEPFRTQFNQEELAEQKKQSTGSTQDSVPFDDGNSSDSNDSQENKNLVDQSDFKDLEIGI